MKIYEVNKSGSLVDVFLGDGWKNWSRYQFDKKGYFMHVGGTVLPRHIIEKVRTEPRKTK